MKIQGTKSLVIPEIKVIKFEMFTDERGYFCETYRRRDFSKLDFMCGVNFVQHNESFSYANTLRGLHFQHSPLMGKLVRAITGRVTEMVLDIRAKSPTFGKIILYELIGNPAIGEWLWIPPGFAHGNFFPVDTHIQYLCSGEYNEKAEFCICPIVEDIDWSLCHNRCLVPDAFYRITQKDANGMSVSGWACHDDVDMFPYEPIS